MAFHESHERLCPACNARISATAPKCFNCGRFVKDAEEGIDDDEPAPTFSFGVKAWVVVIIALIIGIAVLVNVLRDQGVRPQSHLVHR